MNGLQRFVLAIVPRRLGQAIEKESRLWVSVCPGCGQETSIWEAGGIRYLAAGNPRRLRRCPNCGPRWHVVMKKEESNADPLPSKW
ncbi:MAG: hypothetical protein L0211_25185 [Planctomycetaceae bacterium]|nr:hypothetical protein [Planctomycetaceae bacterium]